MPRMLAEHEIVRAALRALPSAGRRIEISSAMMPMTTRSSTSVKPDAQLAAREEFGLFMLMSPAPPGGAAARDVSAMFHGLATRVLLRYSCSVGGGLRLGSAGGL